MGILKEYLNETCPEKPNILCEQKDKIGGRQWDFMWDDQVYPHTKMGWLNDTVERDYKQIISGIFHENKYQKQFIKITYHDFLLQCSLTNINDGLHPMGPGSPPYNALEAYYLIDKHFFKNAKQQQSSLPFESINTWILYCLLSYFLALLLMFTLIRKTPLFKKLVTILLLTIFTILVNNLATSVLSTYNGRFESRVIWVLPLLSLSLFWYWRSYKKEAQ